MTVEIKDDLASKILDTIVSYKGMLELIEEGHLKPDNKKVREEEQKKIEDILSYPWVDEVVKYQKGKNEA